MLICRITLWCFQNFSDFHFQSEEEVILVYAAGATCTYLIHTHFTSRHREPTTPPALPALLTSTHGWSRLAEQLDEAAVAVGLVVLFFEGAFVELLQAEGADKVLRVELLGHGRDAASCYGLLAAGAEGAAALVVVDFTVGLAIVFKEASIHKWGEALLDTDTEGGGSESLRDSRGRRAGLHCATPVQRSSEEPSPTAVFTGMSEESG